MSVWLVSDDDLSQLLEPIELFHSYNVLQHLPVSRGMAIIVRAVTRLAPGGVVAVHVRYAAPCLSLAPRGQLRDGACLPESTAPS